MVEGFNATQRELEILELRKEVSALKTNVEYWRLAAERRDTRKELTGLDVPEARTLDAPEPPQCEVQTNYAQRGEIADAIREYCHSVSPAAVQNSHGVERIYYSGISLDGLTDAVFAILGRAQASLGHSALIPTPEQIEPILDDYLGVDCPHYEEMRRRCAQRIFDLCAVMSGIPITPSDNRIAGGSEIPSASSGSAAK